MLLDTTFLVDLQREAHRAAVKATGNVRPGIAPSA